MSAESARTADVLVPVAVDIAYSYRVPAGMTLAVGDFVNVPLGKREATGIVWAMKDGAGGNLKTILSRRDLPPINSKLRAFVDWVAAWTLSPRGMVLRMGIRAPEVAGPEPLRIGVRLAGPAPLRMTAARTRVIAACEGGNSFGKSALAEAAACSVGVIDSLIDEGTLETVALPPDPVALPPDPNFVIPKLEAQQQSAAQSLIETTKTGEFSVTLLEGVTGSGKTEVYFEAIAEAVRAGRQVLILMPEIALTSQFLDRFAGRFGARPAEWHSGITTRRRERIWNGVADGDVRVVAGARSALFLPFQNLGLIIVDEEHEAAYKQEEGVSYHARDMAVVRGRIESATVILASATPSIETRVNAQQGRYQHLILSERFGGRILPKLAAIDLKTHAAPRGKWISPPLISAVEANLQRGEQSLLFLNRRGYAPLTLCNSCGHRFQCPDCTAWLVEHRFRQALVCHHCGHIERRPDQCPQCEAVDSLTPCGPGVERLAEEAAATFPNAKTIVLSSDNPGGNARVREELEQIAAGDFDIVIGTQLVAKGHNFPKMTLVGVIDADVGLSNGDPRAAERTFQLLHQVTGRAGRGIGIGHGLIQTWQPDHPVMRALLSGDRERFYAEEIASRQIAGLPPFGRLAALIISGPERAAAETHARALARAAHTIEGPWQVAKPGSMPAEGDLLVLGPAEAPIAMVRGRHRFRILIKAPRTADLQRFVRAMLAAGPAERGGVRVASDIDPQSFL